MQVHKFHDGGFVAHGLRFNRDFCKLRLSVWFDNTGHVLDCEGFDSLNRARPVPDKVKRKLGLEFGYVVATYRRQIS
jgi:hypothetical protein